MIPESLLETLLLSVYCCSVAMTQVWRACSVLGAGRLGRQKIPSLSWSGSLRLGEAQSCRRYSVEKLSVEKMQAGAGNRPPQD
jgi:hypothetical protein